MLERPPKGNPPPPSTRRAELRRERDRRHRERIKAGRIVVLVELSGVELDWLVRIHWLTETEANQGNSRLIGAAIAAGLAASAKG
jgi:hypothetical protein